MKSNSSERLKELMAYYGINQTDICQKTGIPKSAISMYASGKRSPRQDRISDIAEAYGVNEAWLMGYDVEMKKEFSYEEGTKDAEFIEKFSLLTQHDKIIVLNLIDTMLKKDEGGVD